MGNLREFDDVQTTRGNILNGVRDAIGKKYPVENDRYRLEVVDLKYDRETAPTIEEQKKRLMQGQNLDRKLHGTWQLVDKATGKVVDKKRAVVAHVPDMTNRGTFIYNGSEYVVANQARLRAGVYTRRKDNGELEAHFNTIPGSGKGFRLHMEPETGIFRMQVGQSYIPLYPLLRSQGVTDAQLEKSWGKELLNVNRAKRADQAVEKAHAKLGVKPLENENHAAGLGRAFGEATLDSEIVATNLGDWFEAPETAVPTAGNELKLPSVKPLEIPKK